MLQGQLRTQTQREVDDRIIHERNEEIRKLALEMEQLCEISADLALLIQTQGEDLDVAEEHVEVSEINVHEAAEHIHTAEKISRKISRKVIGAIITSAGVVIGGGVLAIFSPVIGVVTAGCGLAAGITFTALALKK